MTEVELVVNDAKIELNELVRQILSGMLVGALSSLSGIEQDWKKVELNIKR